MIWRHWVLAKLANKNRPYAWSLNFCAAGCLLMLNFSCSLSGNKGLCGVPSLPECPFFWRNGQLSSRGKIAIGLSCMIVFALLLLGIFIYLRRKRNDYDFGLPHELMCKLIILRFIFSKFCSRLCFFFTFSVEMVLCWVPKRFIPTQFCLLPAFGGTIKWIFLFLHLTEC